MKFEDEMRKNNSFSFTTNFYSNCSLQEQYTEKGRKKMRENQISQLCVYVRVCVCVYPASIQSRKLIRNGR